MCVKHMQYPDKTLATLKQSLQHKNEIVETFRTSSCNICVKYMQHLDQKRLQHTSETAKTL